MERKLRFDISLKKDTRISRRQISTISRGIIGTKNRYNVRECLKGESNKKSLKLCISVTMCAQITFQYPLDVQPNIADIPYITRYKQFAIPNTNR